MRIVIIICLFIGCLNTTYSQVDSASLFKKRKIVLVSSAIGTATIGSTALYFAWYKDYTTHKFHTFNDAPEWLQMDKAGHTLTNYQISNASYHTLKWAGYSDNKSIVVAGLSSLTYMSIIEVMDGYSDGWGFSWSDMGANATGVAIFCGQQYFLRNQIVKMKFSFHQSHYWQYRPNLLGENLLQQSLKDYNGQSYWLSFNIGSVLKEESKFPKWLNVAVGYGADGMISGRDDYVIVPAQGQIIGGDRYRKLFLSLDVDLSKIPTKSKVLKKVFQAINWIKIPAPTLEFSKKGLKGHALYF